MLKFVDSTNIFEISISSSKNLFKCIMKTFNVANYHFIKPFKVFELFQDKKI